MTGPDTLVERDGDGEDEHTVTVPKPMPTAAPAPVATGTTIGRYMILGELGRGAMGTVYRAYDPQLQREVALKRLRPGAADEHAAPRLIREARAMAKLSHPNVVAVHDVVADDDGTVTLAMQCVEGGTLADWLSTPRTPQRILAVVVAAGRGLAAAHRAGLIHRDFKPGNVLLAADGTPKVTDFGLVKVDSRGDESPVPASDAGGPVSADVDDDALTRADAIMGTPRYMAPEQLGHGQADARSDQYALCITLWAALSGSPPFTGDAGALEAAKHAGPPAFPRSVRVPTRVSRALVRGLAPDPAKRFENMDALLRQLEPRGAARRSWAAVGMVAVVGAGVAFAMPGDEAARACAGVDAGLDGAWSDATRARIEAGFRATGEAYVERAWARVDETIEAYIDEWRAQRRDACAAVHVRRVQTIPQMDLRVGCLETARARVVAAIDVLGDADGTVVANAYELVRDLPALERCGDVDSLAGRGRARGHADVDDTRVQRLEAAVARVRALLTAGRFDTALEAAEPAWEASAELGEHPLRARIGRAYASALGHRGRTDEAIAVFRQTLRIAGAAASDEELARVALDLASTLRDDAGRVAEAAWLAELGAGVAQRPGTSDALRARAQTALGGVARAQGQWEEALAFHRRALRMRIDSLGEDHPDVAVSLNNLGLLLYHLDRPKQGIDPLRRARDTWRASYGDDHPEVGTARNNLAMVLERAGRAEEAEAEYREALRIRRSALGERHASTIATRHNLGLVMMTLERHAEAEVEIRAAVDAWTQVLSADHAFIAIGYNSLGLVLRAQDQTDAAEASFREALRRGEAAYDEEHPQMCQFMNNLAATLVDRDAREEAIELLSRSLARCRDKLGPEHRMVETARAALAELQPG